MPRIYLAGPDVFFPDARQTAKARKDFLAQLGMKGVFPLEHFGDIDNLMITQSVIAICPNFEKAAAALRRFFDRSRTVASQPPEIQAIFAESQAHGKVNLTLF